MQWLQDGNEDTTALLRIIRAREDRIQELTNVLIKLRNTVDGTSMKRLSDDQHEPVAKRRKPVAKQNQVAGNDVDNARLCRTIQEVNHGRSVTANKRMIYAQSSLTKAEAIASHLQNVSVAGENGWLCVINEQKSMSP